MRDPKRKKVSKSKRIADNRRRGKSHQDTLEITVPSASGHQRKDGGNARDDFVNDYLGRLYLAIEECLKDIDGELRIYNGV